MTTADQQEFYSNYRALISDAFPVPSNPDNGGEKFPYDKWQTCGQLKMPGLTIEKELNGGGLSALKASLFLEALGYGCGDNGLAFSVGAQLSTGSMMIRRYGSDALKKEYLPGLCDGSLISASAMTERKSGSDIASMQTTAHISDDGYVINGHKSYITNAFVSSIIIVYAITDISEGLIAGITAFVIPTNSSGLFVQEPYPKMGLSSSLLSDVYFDNVVVPTTSVLGNVGEGFRIFQNAMNWERTMLSSGHIGDMQRLTDECIKHVKRRRVHDKSIGKYQAVAHRIASGKINIDAARLLCRRAAEDLDNNSRDTSLNASIAKAYISEHYVEQCLDALRTFGAYGYLKEARIESSLRDATAALSYSGTTDIQKNIISSWLGL